MQIVTPTRVGFAALALVVAGGGTAYAATGGTFVLGRTNTATTTTALVNPYGSALSLTSKAGTAPLRVSNATRVPNLNADRLDDLDSSKLALAAGRTGIVVGTPNDSDGYVNTAQCPSGTVATGGGGYGSDTRDYLYYSGPDINADGSLVPNSWFAVADGNVRAWVVCYNPRGAVAGAVTTVPDLPARGGASSATTRQSNEPGAAPQKRVP